MIYGNKYLKSLIFTLLLALLCLHNPVIAAQQIPALDVSSIDPVLSKIERELKLDPVTLEDLDTYLEQLPAFSTWAKTCIDGSVSSLEDTNKHLETLGYAANNEPPEVGKTRRKIKKEKEALESKLSICNVILVRSEDAIKKISIFRKENLQKQSFDKGQSIVWAFRESVLKVPAWIPDLGHVLQSREGIRALSPSNLLMLMSIALLSLVTGLMIRKRLSRWDGKSLARWQRAHLKGEDTATRLVAAGASTVHRYIVPIILSTAVAAFISIETIDLVPTPLITIAMDGLPFLALVFAVNHFVFRALGKLGLREEVDPGVDNALRKRLNLLALIWYLGYLLFQTVLANSLSEAVFFLVRAVLGVMLALNVIWIIWLSKGIRKTSINTSASVVATLALVVAVIAELTGYRNLSGFILRGVVGTLIAYAIYQIFSQLLSKVLDELDVGKSGWQKQLRKNIGVDGADPIPGLIWLRLVLAVTLWALIIGFLLKAWRVPVSEVKVLEAYILQGFTVGSIEIVPSKIFESLVVLSLLLIANSWFQRGLANKWLALTRIDRGARESISTVSNYAGVAIAILIALGVAGMDFSKLAIVAGALSVGIGFGLQNIVNNFVSGLILLFERPIKTGDWIVAGGVEGLVKRISIRSTQIESFDHADIIVPNSELISGNLTNWLHKSWNGRIRMKLGVAYGSDTEKVRDVLLEIARNHKQVILNNPRMHDPKVMFLSFGDSSLNFELRFFVRNIQNRFDIESDLNFAIDKAFRENDIEIPFPQRVVYLREEGSGSTEHDMLEADDEPLSVEEESSQTPAP